ncbi:relaxase/mobilization nuclease domain-containing protein [Neolewinella maritima]|uniref:relaxase/mobilization nuclease domain-containing protein n=1 Tax=Neolewinella maritima TaxID=1383882 RepID=UPI001EE78BF9|nr:relaxase/mobilization nuclease domain-containing protein [Neolewinella maritima]
MAQADRQSLKEKANSLQSIADRNTRTKRNSVHIALSFAPEDKLNEQQLRSIANDYLKGIGFENQPAYIYRHQDTDNDHIHIVTTNITREGKRIDDSFIGATKSEVTRKEIEVDYQLVKAEERGQKQDKAQRLSELNAPQSGDLSELRTYARHTIRDTLQVYKPANISELNALLRDRDLKVREEKGQTPEGADWKGYSVVRIDVRTGEENSAAIKSSKVFEKGWGSTLDKLLERNGKAASRSLDQVKGSVREAFADDRASTEDVNKALEERQIRTIHHSNQEGRRFGVHYVDEQSGHIYKASQVGRKFTAAEWNRREESNTLSLEDYKALVKDAKQYIASQQGAADYQSVAIKRLNTDDVLFAMAQLGHTSGLIRPYLDEIVASEKKSYDTALKRDEKELKALYWGLAQVKTEFRGSLMNSLGLERQNEHIVLRDNQEVSIPSDQLEIGGEAAVKLKIGELSSEERRMLIGVGRYRGIGGIPLDVNLTTVDWKYWEGKFRPTTAEKLGAQLHNNYVKKELTLLSKRNTEGGGINHPLLQLASKGILVKPTEAGYRAHMVGQETYSFQVPGNLASSVHRQDYRTEHYEKMKSLLEEKIGKTAIDAIQEAKITELRSSTARRKQVPNSLVFELRGYLMSQGAHAKWSGLYKVLQSMDQDENLSMDERRQNRVLRH